MHCPGEMLVGSESKSTTTGQNSRQEQPLTHDNQHASQLKLEEMVDRSNPQYATITTAKAASSNCKVLRQYCCLRKKGL